MAELIQPLWPASPSPSSPRRRSPRRHRRRRRHRGAVKGEDEGRPSVPEGDGREVVQTMCASCHPLTMITGSAGYDQQGWHHLISTMVRMPEAQVKTVSDYLAASFPSKPERRPTLMPGDRRSPSRSGSPQLWASVMGSAATARSHHLLDRHVREPGRSAQSEDRRDAHTSCRRERSRTASSTIATASSGSRATATARSASSIPRPATSRSSRCPSPRRAIRTRRSSITTACCGSRCRTRT